MNPANLPLPSGYTTTNWSVQLNGVSCTSATSCVAVGSLFAETLSGTTWTAANLPVPAEDTTTNTDPFPEDVSCTSSTSCVAVGYVQLGEYGTPSYDEPIAETLSGNTRTPANLPVPTGGAPLADVDGVSCTSATFCVAVYPAPFVDVLS